MKTQINFFSTPIDLYSEGSRYILEVRKACNDAVHMTLIHQVYIGD